MISTASVLLALLLADLGSASPAQVAAIEVPFTTQVGQAASGLKRFFRNGCYQVASHGTSRDLQEGCHLAAEVSQAFQQLDALAANRDGALVKDAANAAARGQPRIAVIRGNGSRWVAANDEVGGELLAAVNAMPTQNQWHARPPARALGKGPQFVAVSVVSTSGGAAARKLQASLSADGRWWCQRSVTGGGGGDARDTSGAARLAPLPTREATSRLARILQGARPKKPMDDDVDSTDEDGFDRAIEVVFPGRPRAALFPKRLAKPVTKRLTSEMVRQSQVCALP